MRTTDAICVDEYDTIYVADFSNNAICVVSPEGEVRVLAFRDGHSSSRIIDSLGGQ
mgnify:CR=1 FL=1